MIARIHEQVAAGPDTAERAQEQGGGPHSACACHGPAAAAEPGARETDLGRIEAAVREILAAVGDDPDRDGLVDTPRRVARAYAQIFGGLREDPARHLARVFKEQSDQIVLLRDIEFHSMCEHHLLPFHGKAHVAYLPDGGQVVGLSKLARTVDAFARRPQVQERLTNQIADALMRHVRAKGVAVVLEAEHFCMKMRGVQKPHSVMVTSALRGLFKHDPAARQEVMSLINRRG